MVFRVPNCGNELQAAAKAKLGLNGKTRVVAVNPIREGFDVYIVDLPCKNGFFAQEVAKHRNVPRESLWEKVAALEEVHGSSTTQFPVFFLEMSGGRYRWSLQQRPAGDST